MRAADKPFSIDKRLVYEAYKAVKSNGGAAGVDGQTIEQFDADLGGNLYKIWNRMSSGSYFPPPVRAVAIPKKSGGQRLLGVPTVADRVAQMVVKQMIEPDLDAVFLADSYGYRPGKSALDAVGVTRKRCWEYDWVLDFDIKGLLDCSSDYPPIPGETAKRSPLASGTLIRKPFRRPWRIWTASSSPRFTRCKMVWRETPSCFVASIMGMKPGGVFSTKRLSRSSVMRISHGAPGVGCSAGMKPSSIQRSTVPDARLSTSAALRTVTGSPPAFRTRPFDRGCHDSDAGFEHARQ